VVIIKSLKHLMSWHSTGRKNNRVKLLKHKIFCGLFNSISRRSNKCTERYKAIPLVKKIIVPQQTI